MKISNTQIAKLNRRINNRKEKLRALVKKTGVNSKEIKDVRRPILYALNLYRALYFYELYMQNNEIWKEIVRIRGEVKKKEADANNIQRFRQLMTRHAEERMEEYGYDLPSIRDDFFAHCNKLLLNPVNGRVIVKGKITTYALGNDGMIVTIYPPYAKVEDAIECASSTDRVKKRLDSIRNLYDQ